MIHFPAFPAGFQSFIRGRWIGILLRVSRVGGDGVSIYVALMVQALHRFMRVLTLSTHGQLRAQVQYPRAENQILHSQIDGPVRLSAHDRARLAKLAKPLGSAIREIISIVKSDTLRRWINQMRRCAGVQVRDACAPRSICPSVASC